MHLFGSCSAIIKCLPQMSVDFRLKVEGRELWERHIVLQHVWWLRLSSVDGRGTTAVEKQQSLQSLICKYANEGVIKIGRLSVALWLLMNSNLQERGKGWWAKNEEKEQGGIVLFLLKNKGKSECGSPWNVKALLNKQKQHDFCCF